MSTLNLTAELEKLVADIARNIQAFSHLEPERILLCVATCRSGRAQGTFAKIHPLRFPGGAESSSFRRGFRCYRCTMPTIVHQGRSMLYVIYFLLPRFLDRPLREKLVTIFHELYHISPHFDGDIRRFPGRNFAHGGSTRRYNLLMEQLVDEYLQLPGREGQLHFLEGDMAGLRLRHRAIVGRKLPVPRLVVTRE
jgi:hypothetical protein